jgi:hypothetical protein
MGCCGSRTPPAGSASPARHHAAPAGVSTPAPPRRYSHAFFEYVGPTALSAVGRATGKHYRFDRPGARVAVDPADRTSVAQVPHLREVYSP